MADPPGRDRILDAAERLFAEQGIEATSARAINAAADLSPAALHYHFRNKEAVVHEVLRRRMLGINASRTEMVTQFIENGDPKDAVRLSEIIILPLVRYAIEMDAPGHWYIRFLSRLYVEKRQMVLDFLDAEHAEGLRLFDGLIQAAGPGLAMDEVVRRRIIAGEIIIHELAKISEFLAESPKKRKVIDPWIRSLITFVAGGLASPPS